MENRALDILSKLEPAFRKRLKANPNQFLPAVEFTIYSNIVDLRKEIQSEEALSILDKLENRIYDWLASSSARDWATLEKECQDDFTALKSILNENHK